MSEADQEEIDDGQRIEEWAGKQDGWADYKARLVTEAILDCDRADQGEGHCACGLFVREQLRKALRRGYAQGLHHGASER